MTRYCWLISQIRLVLIISLFFCVPAYSADCGKLLPNKDGITLGSGRNKMVLERVKEQGRTFLCITDIGPDGKVRREVIPIKPGSPADTQRFTPEGMKD